MGSNLVSSNKLDGNDFITMPGSISVPNSGSFENTGSQMGHANKNIFTKKKTQDVSRKLEHENGKKFSSQD